ncbi:MAG: YaiI/YqxD family protein [Firmicutes bacterium]|nr:YaiI/YqxD family protein [Bacillota bacterium]
MKILVDADSCPVKDIIIELGVEYNLEVYFVTNINHILEVGDKANTIIVDNHSQAADIAIINKAEQGDIVITNDYGLASMALSKKCFSISARGYIYNNKNINNLLNTRHITMKLRKSNKCKIKGPRKRKSADDNKFKKNLELLILKNG